MKKYRFLLNGYPTDLETVLESVNEDVDIIDLIKNGHVEVEDATSDHSLDMLKIEEVQE